jgi:PAS domain-containing protein
MEVINQYDASVSDGDRFRLLVDAITDYAIYMLSPEGFITSWNSGAQRFKGYRPAEIISISPASISTRTAKPVCRFAH